MRGDSDGDGILDKLIRDVLSEMCLLSRDVDEVKGQAFWIFRMRVFEEEGSAVQRLRDGKAQGGQDGWRGADIEKAIGKEEVWEAARVQ